MTDIQTAVSSIDFHQSLNPSLWKEGELRTDVRVALLKSALAFYDFLDLPSMKIESVHLVGSNAGYNYTEWSDCDVHIVVDYAKCGLGTVAENLFTTKKTLWNTLHGSVRVNGFPVELYIEDSRHPVTAAGVYDLLLGRWVTKPAARAPKWNSNAVMAKAEGLIHAIDDILANPTAMQIEHMFAKLKKLRKAGLSQAGEFSTENLAFKTLRNLGYVAMLSDARTKASDDELSLDRDMCREPVCEELNGGLGRCTVQTVNAIADYYHFLPITRETDIPLYGTQVLSYLARFGLHGQPLPVQGETVRDFVSQHRTGTFYVSTEGHAMAVVNGELTDAAQLGPDNRPVVTAYQITR